MKQRPAAVFALDAPQIDGDLCLQRHIDRLGEIVPQQHVLGRNSGVGLQLEHPMAIRPLQVEQRARGRLDAALQVRQSRCPFDSLDGVHRHLAAYFWHTGQKNVERPVCTMRRMMPLQPGVGQGWPSRS